MDRKTAELNRLNNETDALLKGDYQRAITDIVCILRLKNVDDYQVEEIRNDVTDLLLRSQEQGRSVEEALGGDIRSFCDTLLESAGKKSFGAVVLENLQSVLVCLLILTGLSFLSSTVGKLVICLRTGTAFDWQWDITAGDVATWLVLSAAVFGILYIALSSPSTGKPTRRRRWESLAFGVGVMGGCLLLAWLSAAYLPDTVLRLPAVPAGAVYLLAAAAFLIRRLMRKRRPAGG